jgi:hypothetical protein
LLSKCHIYLKKDALTTFEADHVDMLREKVDNCLLEKDYGINRDQQAEKWGKFLLIHHTIRLEEIIPLKLDYCGFI